MSGIVDGSPNFGPRPEGARVRLIVVHYTAMTSAAAARKVLCAPDPGVSAHYLIAEDGDCEQLVDEADRAWHAGAGAWGGWSNVNDVSVGIELANPGCAPFAARQMDRLEGVLAGIMDRHGIPPEGVIGHSDMAPGRKQDPGARFDWRRLARGGLSVWPEAEDGAADWQAFREGCRGFGYPKGIEDGLLLRVFRLRFAPTLLSDPDLPLTGRETAMAADLAARFPFDRAACGA